MKLIRLLNLILFYIPICFYAQNRLDSIEIWSPQLQITKKIWIYKPLNYNTKKNKKYPVMYMHDAQNLFDSRKSYAGEWYVDETLDSLKAAVIVIGIEHGNEKRLDELTPFEHPNYGGGNAALYLDFIIQTLKPKIDSLYRTKKNRKFTGIMGSSLGGLTSFYAGIKHQKTFSKVGVFSPSFWYSDKIYECAKQFKFSSSKFYFMCGTDESESMETDMCKIIQLLELNLSHKNIFSLIVPYGKHHEKLWAKEFAKAYLWLFKQ